jgi:uncharacterized membrane protein
MHEGQWRGSYEPQGNRQQDIRSIYELRDWESTLALLRQYNVRYIFIGSLERSTYRIYEDKFEQNLRRVFSQGQVTIYEGP